MAVNEKLLALEQAVKEKGGEGEVEPATGGDELTGEPLRCVEDDPYLYVSV